MEKSLDIRREVLDFWRDLRSWCEEVRVHAYGALDYGVLGRLQSIEVAWPRADVDALSTLRALGDVVLHLESLSPCDVLGESLLTRGRRLSRLGAGDFLHRGDDGRFDGLSARLYGMHRFLEGESGGEDFGRTTRLEHGDFAYGLGLRLCNGRLHELFMRLKRMAGANSESYFRQFFDDETEALLASLESDASQFMAYMQSHLILRYDAVFSRSNYELSPTMQQYLGRLGADVRARREQIGIVSGERFSDARRDATETGVRSLRGFAMLFDLGKRVSEQALERMSGHLCESEKCLSLADSVISRLHGMHAQHWQMRLESVYRGRGMVGDRFYEESRFLGANAGGLDWEEAEFGTMLDGVTPRPSAGHYYVICQGDRLRQLIAEAYGTSRDYRIVLQQNPQIVQAERLTPGMKIYFPKIDGGLILDVAGAAGADSTGKTPELSGKVAILGGDAVSMGDAVSILSGKTPELSGKAAVLGGDAGDVDDGGNIESRDLIDNLAIDGEERENGAKCERVEEQKNARIVGSGDGIELLGELIDDLSCMRRDQIEAMCEKLNELSASQYVRTVCVDQDEGVCLVCDRVVLFVSEDDNMSRYMETSFSTPSFLATGDVIRRRARAAFRAWGRALAAQIRGDVVVSADCSLPLARFADQRNRRAWVTTALRRLREASASDVKFVVHGRDRRVDVVDKYGVCVVQLQSEDFRAMRMQPWRRYVDYYAPPLVQMNALMQVWLGDLFGLSVEIGVPPLSYANQYSIEQGAGVVTFGVPMGTPVYPIMRGRVVSVGDDAERGKYVVVAHHDGLYSRYMSLSTSFVEVGMQVEAETTIGRSGCAGNDIDAKLCLEIVECHDVEIDDNIDSSKDILPGKRFDYFDIIYNVWPRELRFDGVIEAE